MKTWRVIVGLSALSFHAASPASAVVLEKVDVSCPSQVQVGDTLTMNVHLENKHCAAADVRLMSGIAGNAADSVGGVGVFGPVVASQVVVPAATVSCGSTWATPGTLDLNLGAPPAAPAAHLGTVEVHLLISEWDVGTVPRITRVDQCLVEVVSP